MLSRKSRKFQSTPSAWRETKRCFNICTVFIFQSTPSAWRETSVRTRIRQHTIHFNPLPPHGGRLSLRTRLYKLPYFNPLPPHGGRPPYFAQIPAEEFNFNPLPPHGGRQPRQRTKYDCQKFQSTPSAWRETYTNAGTSTRQCISIHSLRMEGDGNRGYPQRPRIPFQSTPSAWRETGRLPIREVGAFHFNPLPPHGGRPVTGTTAPYTSEFQSTPSAWRETQRATGHYSTAPISIHSLRMEGDIPPIHQRQ